MSNTGRTLPESDVSRRTRAHRRVELCVLVALLMVAFVAWWSTRVADTRSSVIIEVAAQAPLAQPAFELTPPPAAASDVTPSSTRAPRPVKRSSENSSTPTLTVLLHNAHGSPFFDYIDEHDQETAGALRLVYLEACPRVGLDLPNTVRRLAHRSNDVRKQRLAQWMRTSFQKPTDGCACAVLGRRVLAAEPFVAAQPRLLLTVNPAELVAQRCALRILVVDEQRGTPIAGARVTLRGQHRERKEVTDAGGAADWFDLVPGDVTVHVTHASYSAGARAVSFTAGRQSAVETIRLQRLNVISGTVRWPVANPPAARVALMSADSSSPTFRAVDLDPRGWTGRFRFENIKAGEYIVGLATQAPYPTAEQVKHREVDGWAFVNARFGDVEGVWIDVTPALSAPEPVPKSSR